MLDFELEFNNIDNSNLQQPSNECLENSNEDVNTRYYGYGSSSDHLVTSNKCLETANDDINTIQTIAPSLSSNLRDILDSDRSEDE